MSEAARFTETLRRLAIIDERFVADQAGLGLGPAGTLGVHGVGRESGLSC